MKSTKEIKASDFKLFIKSNKICVVRAQGEAGTDFNTFLKIKLTSEFKDLVSFGWINTKKINNRSSAMKEFIESMMPKIGLRGTTMLPGYYLFKDGALKAYHPATFDPNKIDPQVSGAATLFGVIAGIFVGVVEKNATKGFEVFFKAMEAPVGEKVFQFFKEILGARSSSYSQQRQSFVLNEEILNAYKLLKISPMATDLEVSKAWKILLREHHPDLHPNDIDAKTKYCSELNNAYEIIKKHRKNS